MYRFLFLLLMIFFSCSVFSQRLMDLRVVSAQGDSVALSSLAGKPFLFVVAGSSSDSLVMELQSFTQRYGDSVQVVVFPAAEFGCSAVLPSGLLSLPQSVLVARSGYVQKSQSQQSAVLSWLTHKEQNYHFDLEVSAPGQKFFVTRSGRLMAVFPGHVRLSSTIIPRVMQTLLTTPQTP